MIWSSTEKHCRHCGSRLDIAMVHKDQYDSVEFDYLVFAKSLPVLWCPHCDGGSDPTSRALHDKLDTHAD